MSLENPSNEYEILLREDDSKKLELDPSFMLYSNLIPVNFIKLLSILDHPELLNFTLNKDFSPLSSSEYFTEEEPISSLAEFLSEDILLLTTKSSKVSSSTINISLPDFFPLYTNSLSKAFLYPSTVDRSKELSKINPFVYMPSVLHSSSI